MDLAELLDDLGIEHREGGQHRHVTIGWHGLDCPHCSPRSGKFRLGIHARTLAVSCWVCGRHRLADTLALASGQRVGEILRHLPGIAPGSLRSDDLRPAGKFLPPEGIAPLTAPYRRYLASRGFDPDVCEAVWGFRGTPGVGEYAWRVYLPCPGRDGKDGSWTTRAIGPRVEKRYLSSPPTREVRPLKSLLFGEHLVRGHALVVCEGPLDAVAVGPGAVATCGLGVTPAQLRRIAQYPVRVFCFDSEVQAQRRADEAIDLLGAFAGVSYKVRLSGKDATDSPADERDELRARFLDA